MKKNLLTSLALVAALFMAIGGATFANCGKCPGDKAGKKAEGCCPEMKVVGDAFKALQADLAKMDKPMSADEQAAFMKSHKENLKKYMDAKSACDKACSVKGEKDAKGCAGHAEKKG